MKRAVKYICLVVGSVALVLGIVGIFLPMWPTTPFLLLAAACFVRSSERLYTWLLEHEHLGPYVRDYHSGKGIPLKAKQVALITMWVTSQASWMVIMAHRGATPWTIGYAVLLVVVAVGVHYYIGYRIPTREPEDSGADDGDSRYATSATIAAQTNRGSGIAMRTIRVGLVGLGTVGSGVVEIVMRHGEQFRTRSGVSLELAKCADRDPARAEALALAPGVFTTDVAEIIGDPSIDVVVELVGGTGVARTIVLDALAAGKSVVTANKALMATHGEEIMHAAEAAGVDILFEASVGGGIPIIGPLKHSLVSNEIQAVYGIVNGTTNYMLTRMAADGLDYETALAEAQARGFAEADPTADVDGLDAAAKIAILASIAFNSRVTFADVPAEGIRSIAPTDIAYAHETGYTIKLMAIGKRTPEGLDIRVQPTMIRADHPLAKVNGVYNAIYVVGDAVGETMFFGEGAGSLPAASAVVGDVIEAARHIQGDCRGLVGCTCAEHLAVRDIADLTTSYYLRLHVRDEPGVLASIAGIFGEHGVSLASVIQKHAEDGGAEIVWITHRAAERDVRAALAAIEALEVVDAVGSVLRVEEL